MHFISCLCFIHACSAFSDTTEGNDHPAFKGFLSGLSPFRHDGIQRVFVAHGHFPTITHQQAFKPFGFDAGQEVLHQMLGVFINTILC